jgi:hypothetical protein
VWASGARQALTAPSRGFTLCSAKPDRGRATERQGDENGMSDSRVDQRFDELVSQVHDWVESAVALDEGHFPSELLSDLRDLIEELKAFLEDDDSSSYSRNDVLEIFVTPEMGEVMHRFPKVRRLLESAWGSQLTELIEEESAGFDPEGDDDDDD